MVNYIYFSMNKTNKETVNSSIVYENQCLQEVFDLIKNRCDPSLWPKNIVDTFVEAFFQDKDQLGEMEYRKMMSGRYTLGISENFSVHVDQTRLAERFRADLPGIVKFKSGRWIKVGNLTEEQKPACR